MHCQNYYLGYLTSRIICMEKDNETTKSIYWALWIVIAVYRASSGPSGRSRPPNLSLIDSLAWGTSVHKVSVRVKRCPRTKDKGAATTTWEGTGDSEEKLACSSTTAEIRLNFNCKYARFPYSFPPESHKGQDGRRVCKTLQAGILEMEER